MIKIGDYIFNKDEVQYIEKYGTYYIMIHFKDRSHLTIGFDDERDRDNAFDKIWIGL